MHAHFCHSCNWWTLNYSEYLPLPSKCPNPIIPCKKLPSSFSFLVTLYGCYSLPNLYPPTHTHTPSPTPHPPRATPWGQWARQAPFRPLHTHSLLWLTPTGKSRHQYIPISFTEGTYSPKRRGACPEAQCGQNHGLKSCVPKSPGFPPLGLWPCWALLILPSAWHTIEFHFCFIY